MLYSVLMFGDKTRVKIKGSLSTPPLLPDFPSYPSARVYVHAISPFALFPTLPRNHNCQLQRAATRVVRFSSSAEETTQHTHIHPRVMYMCGVRVCVCVVCEHVEGKIQTKPNLVIIYTRWGGRLQCNEIILLSGCRVCYSFRTDSECASPISVYNMLYIM